MRCGSLAASATVLLFASSSTPESLPLVHQQRYAMGTMFEIVVYHAAREEAERAAAAALDEVVRLDRVMSHYKADSDLAKLLRDGRNGFAKVDADLYGVIQQSIAFSRVSGGRFDVTIAPLVKIWRNARAAGRPPTDEDISGARRCVGYEKIEMQAPDRIRINSDCLDIDLGGIGKGYAVDRALTVLKSARIRHAIVNAGSSSIAAIGSPPGRSGWPVELGATIDGRRTLLLHDRSIATSQQPAGAAGEIVDPQTGTPLESGGAVSVVAPSATLSDALSTILLLLPADDGSKLLGKFSDVSALWISRRGELKAVHRKSRLELSGTH